MCSYVTAHVLMTLQKATLLMSILAVAWRNRLDSVSDYYTKDKS